MTIGDLARRARVPVSTLRFYERRDLLHADGRSPSGYRLYAEAAVERVLFIRRAQSLGFRIDEVRELLDVAKHARLTREQLQEFGRAKMTDIEEKLVQLRSMHDALSRLLNSSSIDWAEPCPVVASLTSDLDPAAAHHAQCAARPRRNHGSGD